MTTTDIARNVWPGHMRADTAAAYLDTSVRNFQRMVSAGIIKPRKLGPRTLRYSREELDRAAASMPRERGDCPAR